MKKLSAWLLLVTLLLSGCNFDKKKVDGVKIELSDDNITVDGQEVTTDNTQAVFSANDIVFYLAGQNFTYGEGEKQDEHEQKDADAHTVVHITKPGTYVLSGKLSLGQIAVDLGEEAKSDPNAVVTLVLNNVDITCTVAPAIIFYNVYECCDADEETATKDVDTKNAGANVIIADGTENNITGSYVAKIYESYELSEDGKEIADSEKLHKYDGAFYSKQTMNITGENKGDGILNIKAKNEGLGSELHLTINGGIINITSGNDGINTNEDNVSVTTINGGTLNILCDGATGEGDGIDSNGWLVINGGTVTAQACSTSGDAGIDSDKGIHINGGKVIATGNMLDRIADSEQTYVVFSFSDSQKSNKYTLKDSNGKIVEEFTPTNSFTYLIIAGDNLVEGDYTFWQGETQLAAIKSDNMQGMRPGMPNGMPNGQSTPPQFPEGAERPERPDTERPQGEMPSLSDGMKPNDTPPQMPEDTKPNMPEGITPPGYRGEMPDENMMQNGEPSTMFTITEGSNYFVNVSPVLS